MGIKLTPAIASTLIRSHFGSVFDFEIVGSLATSIRPEQAKDVDFIIKVNDFHRLLLPLNNCDWEESEYFEGESYKTDLDGIIFNAIALEPPDYARWKWAAKVMAFAPVYLKPSNKHDRLRVWEWLISIAPCDGEEDPPPSDGGYEAGAMWTGHAIRPEGEEVQ